MRRVLPAWGAHVLAVVRWGRAGGGAAGLGSSHTPSAQSPLTCLLLDLSAERSSLSDSLLFPTDQGADAGNFLNQGYLKITLVVC